VSGRRQRHPAPTGIRALADPEKALRPSAGTLVLESATIVGAAVATFLLVGDAIDVEGTPWFRFLYERHILDEVLLAVLVLLVGIIFTSLRRLRMTTRAAQAVAAQRTAFEATVASVPDALVLADREGYMFANEAGARLFGVPANQPFAQDVAALMEKTDARDGATGRPLGKDDLALTAALSGRKAEGNEILRHSTTGDDRHVMMRSAPIRLGDEILGAVMVARDVTDLWRLQSDLAEANARLKSSDANRLRMVRMVAHDLANALAPVGLQLATMKLPSAGPDALAHGTAVIQRSAANVRRLAGDLSDMAKLEAGTLPLHGAPMDLAQAVAAAVDAARGTAEAKGLRLADESPPGALPLTADRDRVAQVLDNLLSNAIKFTPSGGAVTIRASSCGPEDRVDVADTGLGLTQGQAVRLFQPFSRVHEEQASAIVGSGLGLFICKGLVSAHGGRIMVESAGPGRGSTFSFTLPTAAAAPAA
jgi:signal transduction histidine kinase